jgi:hypothetical protein
MDESDANEPVSAYVFDIVREAFRKSVRELNLPEEEWAEHAKLLMREMIGRDPNQNMIDRIIGR